MVRRVSSDKDYLESGKVVLDADGIPLILAGPAESAGGTGWTAYKRLGQVDLHLSGVDEPFTIPAGWRPGSSLVAPIALGKAADTARFLISTSGEVTFQSHTFPVYGFVSYLAQG